MAGKNLHADGKEQSQQSADPWPTMQRKKDYQQKKQVRDADPLGECLKDCGLQGNEKNTQEEEKKESHGVVSINQPMNPPGE